MRGGHQMCFDEEHQLLLLFGGWDGSQDLADLWLYDVKTSEWECLSANTSENGGPLPRSCHKICFDQTTRQMYTLGGYFDLEQRSTPLMSSDFFRYDLAARTWTKISNDTHEDGGPELIYDHHMVVDQTSRLIYVFGGR